MMEFLNAASKETSIGKDAPSLYEALSPYAPHVAEEVWEKYGFKNTISYNPGLHMTKIYAKKRPSIFLLKLKVS